MRETRKVGVEKLLVPTHSSSQKEEVLQKDREAHRTEDKGVPMRFFRVDGMQASSALHSWTLPR